MRVMRTTEDSAKSLWQLATLLVLVLAASMLLLELVGFKAASAATRKVNGSITYATYFDPTIYTVKEAGGVPTAVDGSSIGGDIHGLAFSPDAAEIAFSGHGSGGAPMIYTVPATGGVAKPLIDEGPCERFTTSLGHQTAPRLHTMGGILLIECLTRFSQYRLAAVCLRQ